MTDSLPAPLVPAECNLRDFAFMPLDVVRLRDSDLTAVPDAEVFRAAVVSWCVAWHQEPAASLPDDDAVLAKLLGYGRDVKGWKKLRDAGALRNFVKCSDGRLYHPVVAEKANEAWAEKLSYRGFQSSQSHKGKLGAAKRWGKPLPQDDDSSGDSSGHSTGHDKAKPEPSEKNSLKGQGQGQGKIEDGAKAAPPKPKAVKTRLPSDWTLPPEWRAWSAENRPDLNADAVALSFRDYWLSPDAKLPLKADWFRVWKTWIDRTEARGKFRAQPGTAAAPSNDPPSRIAYRKAFAEWDGAGRTGEKPTLAQFAHLDRPPESPRAEAPKNTAPEAPTLGLGDPGDIPGFLRRRA